MDKLEKAVKCISYFVHMVMGEVHHSHPPFAELPIPDMTIEECAEHCYGCALAMHNSRHGF